MSKKLSYATRDKLITYSIVIIAFLIAELLMVTGIASNKFTGLLIPISINILLAMSLNLVVGISGELSLGHAGFMCIGAYAGSLFSVLMQNIIPVSYIRFPLAIILGGIIAAILGFLIGIPVLSLRGDYLAIVTLAFGEIIKMPYVKISGVMNMAPIDSSDEKLHYLFKNIKQIHDDLESEFKLELKHISMGMSRDFRQALEEGASMIRLGRILFE